MRKVLAFSVVYLLAGSVWFLRTGNSEFVIYVLVIAVLLAGLVWLQRTARFPTWMLWGFSLWGLMHVLGGGVVMGEHVLFAQRIFPLVDQGGDFYILKYDQVVHAYLYGLVAVMALHVLRQVFGARGPAAALAVTAVLVSLGVSSLNELMEFLISLNMDNGVGGYDNTMLDFVSNFTGAVVATTVCTIIRSRRSGEVLEPVG
ncbi:putative membrane protein [Nocardioides albertanoniae]|uniref:Putative membrane protein n=1 Tax=Nocardioides albertanoniae TaxID=1175486 RepID=A0A543A7P7_9ACTN|nr:DUF2238 domain-containing protein [Nocardioides albertanoniae]TQL68631.1 putative membrane protein [Nocardioides albertanoniae]